MISPILPAHDADTIALDLGVFIACRSREYRCSQEAIIAAIHAALPSQPGETSRSHAPAADTSVEPLADVTTDGGADPSATPSVSPSTGLRELAQREAVVTTEAPTPLPEGGGQRAPTIKTRPAEEKTSAQEASADASGGVQDRCESTPPTPSETGKPVESSGSAAPVPKYELVRQCHNEHPDWPSSKIAEATGVRRDQIHGLARFAGISIPSEAEYRRGLRDKTTTALRTTEKPPQPQKAAARPPSPPPPQQPPASTPEPRFRVIAEDGRYVHKRLQPSHTGMGVKLTDQAEIAWTPTEAQFAEAARKFPDLKAMRWEAVQP